MGGLYKFYLPNIYSFYPSITVFTLSIHIRGIIKKGYLVIILGNNFVLFLHEKICYW